MAALSTISAVDTSPTAVIAESSSLSSRAKHVLQAFRLQIYYLKQSDLTATG